MTTYTIEVLLQAIEECPNAIYSLGDPRSWILKRARELAAAALNLSTFEQQKEWLARKLAHNDDSNAAAGIDPSCLCCGKVGTPKVWVIDNPFIYVCETCKAKSDAQPSASEPVACPYLLEGTRFKLSFDRRGNVGVFSNYAEELDGRWVALVDATDNRHMDAPQPSPQPSASDADYVLVPREPTKEFFQPAYKQLGYPGGNGTFLQRAWPLLLAAATITAAGSTREVTDEIDMAKVWESFKFIESACSCHDQERGGSSDEDLAIVRSALESFAATRAQD